MNRYLEKLAESAKETLPYRKRVEVLIVKDGKILVCENRNKQNGETWYGFPGGGLDGDSAKDACIKECLEEVGVRISNPIKLDVPEHTQEGIGKKDNRHLYYRGSKTTWYVADFDKLDRTMLEEGRRGLQNRFVDPSEALELISKGKVMATPRIRAIMALKASKEV